jgi:hypothetical protein
MKCFLELLGTRFVFNFWQLRLIIQREMVSRFNIAQIISRELITYTKLLLESRSR